MMHRVLPVHRSYLLLEGRGERNLFAYHRFMSVMSEHVRRL